MLLLLSSVDTRCTHALDCSVRFVSSHLLLSDLVPRTGSRHPKSGNPHYMSNYGHPCWLKCG